MFDFEQILLSEQKNPNALVLEFINSEYDESDIVAFVEGIYDPHFYYDLIAASVPDRQIRFYDCGGKRSVLCVKEFIAGYELTVVPHKILYLCDLDFDLVLNKNYQDVFRTDFYSIESYFADVHYIDYLISKYCPTLIKKNVRVKLLSQIDQEILLFSKYLMTPMAFLCHIREGDRSADFDRLSVVDFLDIQVPSRRVRKCKSRLSLIINRTGASTEQINMKKVYAYAHRMKGLSYKYWIRGKLALQLLKFCLRRASNAFDNVIQSAAGTLCNYIGVTALSQSKTFLKSVPELDRYVLSV